MANDQHDPNLTAAAREAHATIARLYEQAMAALDPDRRPPGPTRRAERPSEADDTSRGDWFGPAHPQHGQPRRGDAGDRIRRR